MSEMMPLRRAALVAAVSLVVMAVLSPIAFFYIFPKLIVRSDVEQTMRNIVAHEPLYLAGLACYLVTFICDVLAAWALYVFFRPAHAPLSMLAAWFRLVYTVLALGAWMKLVTVLRLVKADATAAFDGRERAVQVHVLLSAFRFEWGVSLVLFAIYLVLLGWLATMARYVPRILGALLVINGLAYLVDSLRPFLFPAASLRFLPALFFGELIFMLWLFVKGSRLADVVTEAAP